jgi:hypothetical protein
MQRVAAHQQRKTMKKILIDEATVKQMMESAYREGFKASGEGYNQEYPFDQYDKNPEADDDWAYGRDEKLKKLMPQPEDNDFPLGKACDLLGEGGCEACQ